LDTDIEKASIKSHQPLLKKLNTSPFIADKFGMAKGWSDGQLQYFETSGSTGVVVCPHWQMWHYMVWKAYACTCKGAKVVAMPTI